MKLRVQWLRRWLLALLVVAPGGGPGLHAAQANTNAPAPLPPTATNAVPAAQVIPQSIFVLPRNLEEGRDPFFPTSTRHLAAAPVATNVVRVDIMADLELKGFSEMAGRRLAIINNHPFEPGESGDVITSTGRLRIRCVEIRKNSVVVEIAGERRELFYRERN